jgi:hypothetical protein
VCGLGRESDGEACVCVCARARVRARAHVHTCVYARAHVHMCECVCLCVCVCDDTHKCLVSDCMCAVCAPGSPWNNSWVSRVGEDVFGI